MTKWQFLIRKEDDLAWLPLESTNTEILEGRYQLVVELGTAAVPVDVQVRHEFEQDGFFKQTHQQKLLMTDFQGQAELTALAYFAPGHWEIKCCIPENQEGTPTPLDLEPVTLSLQILAQEYGCLSEWDLVESSTPQSPTVIPQPELVGAGVGPINALADQTPLPPQLNPAALKVSLPVIPKDLPPLELFTIETFNLPPMLYQPGTEGSTRHELQLPCLPPLEPLMTEAAPMTGEQELIELREYAKDCAKNSAAERDFKHLSRQPHFLETLFTLSRSPLATSSLLIFQETLAAALGKPLAVTTTNTWFEGASGESIDALHPNTQIALPAIDFELPETESLISELDSSLCTPPEESLQVELNPFISSPVPPDFELPVPRLIFSGGTLLADEVMNLLVRLPQSADRFQVKIWMNDRYTGDPVGELTMLSDWTLNGGLGVLESSTQIVAPPGCFAIRFSAVTLDPQTQAESSVVVVDRYIGIQN